MSTEKKELTHEQLINLVKGIHAKEETYLLYVREPKTSLVNANISPEQLIELLKHLVVQNPGFALSIGYMAKEITEVATRMMLEKFEAK